uniref:O-acyl-ADP-ribose deacylase 1 n=1 Tax=Cynoglossus semilaevis TaxID=244447 RepID=A0A3P8WQ02_CYNSE
MFYVFFAEPSSTKTEGPEREGDSSEIQDYVTGDLFSCPRDEALAHCISEDCRMGAGIAVLFKQKFKGVERLKEQKKVPGQCAVLQRDGRFVYYLVTKKRASQKPTYDSLTRSLEDMKSHCLRNEVTKISMPRIGCGLDRLEWRRVAVILEQVFKHTNISITVYSLPAKAQTAVMKENWRR